LQRRIADSLQTLSLPPGTVVFDERQPCADFPFVLDGAIRVAKLSSGGRELPLYRVQRARAASSPRVACSATPTTTRAA
jgi:CRP/FNR family transcriptional regulator